MCPLRLRGVFQTIPLCSLCLCGVLTRSYAPCTLCTRQRRGGGTGRRSGLKIRSLPRRREGPSPSPGTKQSTSRQHSVAGFLRDRSMILCWTAARIVQVSSCVSMALTMTTSLGQAAQPAAASADWATSPEAVFLTLDEQKSWREIQSDADRARFQAEYWKRRDPDPGTPINEFKQLVDARIAAADKYFALAGKPGSQTAQGRVFVLLGPASSEQLVEGPLDNAPQYVTPWQVSLPRGALDHQAWTTWVYDARRKDVLKVIHRSSLELSFSIDPGPGRCTTELGSTGTHSAIDCGSLNPSAVT